MKAKTWCLQGSKVSLHKSHLAINVADDEVIADPILEIEWQGLPKPPAPGSALRDDEIVELERTLIRDKGVTLISSKDLLKAALAVASVRAGRKQLDRKTKKHTAEQDSSSDDSSSHGKSSNSNSSSPDGASSKSSKSDSSAS